jgi:hypothetical protein
VPDEFFDRPDLTPEREWLAMRLERLARERPYCLTSNEELMELTGWSRNTLAKHLREYEADGWCRRRLIPGSHGRATGRVGIVLLVRPTGRPVATPETHDQVVAMMEAEIRRAKGRPSTLPFPPDPPQDLGTAVPKDWAPSVPKVWGPPCIKGENTGEGTETTTTASPGSGEPSVIHACEESSSSLPISIPIQTPEKTPLREATVEAPPIVEALPVARPDAAAHQALLIALAARAVALFGLDAHRARGKVAVAIDRGRRIASEHEFRFEPAWVGAAMDEAGRLKAAGKAREWGWGVVMGIVQNYAREGGPDAREGPRRPGEGRPFDPAVCLARMACSGWELVAIGPDRVKWSEMADRPASLWRVIPGDLRGEVAAHKAELKAYVLGRPSP